MSAPDAPDRLARDRLRQFEALVHASPEFIAIADLQGKVLFLNDAGRRMVGMPDGLDVTTTSIVDFLTAEGLQASIDVEQPAVQRDGHWSGQSTLRDWRGGAAIPVAVSSFLATDPTSGRPIAMATVQHDLRPVLAATAQANAAEAALEEIRQRNHALLLHMSDVLVVIDQDRKLTFASPSAARVLGYDEGSRLGADLLDLLHPEDREQARDAIAHLLDTPGGESSMKVRIAATDGTYRFYEGLATNLLHEPAVGGIVIAARDVSERHRAESEQNLQAGVLELIATGAPVTEVLSALATLVERLLGDVACSILLTEDTPSGTVLRHAASPSLPHDYEAAVDGMNVSVSFSPCAVSVTNLTPTLVPDMLADERWAPYHDLARRLGLRSCWSYPVISPASGRILGTFALYRSEPGLPDAGMQSLLARASHLMGIAVDRDDLVKRLAYRATHDDLTGLPNRAMLLDHLNEQLRQEPGRTHGPLLIFLDLDRLKIVNDSLGHERGDELLSRVAERLPGAVPKDVLVARFGGDEFVVLADDVASREEATELVESVLEAISQPLSLEGRQINPSASAGVVMTMPGQTAMEVLRDADIAMYRAKAIAGSSYQFSDEAMRHRAFDRLELEEQLRSGLAQEEFVVHYQPLVNLADESLVGFEALVRWDHPKRGLLSPHEFIHLAEETGLIRPLGDLVLRATARTAARWATEFDVTGLKLSVNVSAKQLTPELIPVVHECLTRISPWSLCLELTESTWMGESMASWSLLEQLSDTGVELSIDDFGTGFSSLSYLTRLPLNYLKIDRSFVTEIETKPEAMEVAKAVVGLGHSLGLTVIGEGIETQGQRNALLDLGCQHAQGYLFGRPTDEDATTELLRHLVKPR